MGCVKSVKKEREIKNIPKSTTKEKLPVPASPKLRGANFSTMAATVLALLEKAAYDRLLPLKPSWSLGESGSILVSLPPKAEAKVVKCRNYTSFDEDGRPQSEMVKCIISYNDAVAFKQHGDGTGIQEQSCKKLTLEFDVTNPPTRLKALDHLDNSVLQFSSCSKLIYPFELEQETNSYVRTMYLGKEFDLRNRNVEGKEITSIQMYNLSVGDRYLRITHDSFTEREFGGTKAPGWSDVTIPLATGKRTILEGDNLNGQTKYMDERTVKKERFGAFEYDYSGPLHEPKKSDETRVGSIRIRHWDETVIKGIKIMVEEFNESLDRILLNALQHN